MKVHKYIILLICITLQGCVTATTGMTPKQEAYFKEIADKNYDNIFSKDEIDTAWSRSIQFWKKYGLLKEATDIYIETHRSLNTDIKYTFSRVKKGNEYEIKGKIMLNNPFMGGFAERTIVFYHEFVNTGIIRYSGLVMP